MLRSSEDTAFTKAVPDSFRINNYDISTGPYKKIYLLLKHGKQDKIYRHIKKLYGIYKKMSNRRMHMRMIEYLKDYIIILKQFHSILQLKKIFKRKTKKKPSGLQVIQETEKSFTHFYVAVENFLNYESEFFDKCLYYQKLETEFLKVYVQNSFYDIFEVVFFKNYNTDISKRIFDDYIALKTPLNSPSGNTLKPFLDYLFFKFSNIISRKEIKQNIFIINSVDYLQEIFSYIYRTQKMFIHFACNQETSFFIIENYIEKIFSTLHIFFKTRIDEIPKKDFDIEHFLCFYRYIKKFEEYFSSIYSPLCFDNYITKVFNEKIEIDFAEYQKEKIKEKFKDTYKNFGENPFVKIKRLDGLVEHISIYETVWDVIHLLNECYTKSFPFGYKKEIVKVWEKYIIINYLTIYRHHIDTINYKEIDTMIATVDFLIRKYKEMDERMCSKKLLEYCEKYKKELNDFYIEEQQNAIFPFNF